MVGSCCLGQFVGRGFDGSRRPVCGPTASPASCLLQAVLSAVVVSSPPARGRSSSSSSEPGVVDPISVGTLMRQELPLAGLQHSEL